MRSKTLSKVFVFIEKESPIKNLMYQAGLIRDEGSRPIRFITLCLLIIRKASRKLNVRCRFDNMK